METGAQERARPSFGTLLRCYRVAAGLTQEELAERACLSRRSITALEQGKVHSPRRDTLDLLATALAIAAGERADFLAAGRYQGTYGPSGQGGSAGAEAAPALVGRASELALLVRHLAGQGPPVLLLAGEPGIGKSRLLHAAIPRAVARGWRVLEGGCGRRGGQEPYAPILAALQGHIRGLPVADLCVQLRGCAWLVRLLPELADGPIEPLPRWTVSAEQERRLMAEAVARFVKNVAGPFGTLLLLDDLQWAGPDALDLLATLVRVAADVPLRVIGAYRDTEVRTQGSLGGMLADLVPMGLVAHRQLMPLTPAEAAALLDGLLTDMAEAPRARLLERAGGVPFFLISCVEGLRHSALTGGQDTLPWAVEQSIRRRLAALPAGAAEVLAAAAVVGREVARALLVTVTGLDERTVLAACDAACRARLLEEQGADNYRFAHDAIREVLENDLGAGRRAVAHGRIAEALEQAPGERPMELLCYHYERCGDQDKAMHYLEQAGDQARAQAASASAEKRYRDLIQCLDRLGRVLDSARVREKLAGVLATTARYDAALAMLDEATVTLHAAGDLEGLGRIAALLGNIHFHRGTLEEGVACLLPLQERLEARGPSVALAMVYCALAELNLNWGHWAQEEVAAERAGHIARLVGDDLSLARAELLRGVARSLMSRDDEELTVLSEAVRLAESVGELECLSQVPLYVTEVYAERGEFDQSRRYVDRALRAAEKVGNPVLMADALIGLGLLAFYGDDWARARGCYQRASVIHQQIAIAPFSCEAGGLLVVQGQLL